MRLDRALDTNSLVTALGTHAKLPSPTELRQLLADAEIGLFTQTGEIGNGLLDSAWYLQSIATARSDLQNFSVERRRRAHQVSAHIFDVALQRSGFDRIEALRHAFAAQIGYIGGELTPNATAIARRAPSSVPPYEWLGPSVASLEAGIQLLALNRSQLYPLLRARRAQFRNFEQQLGALGNSPLAAANAVIQAVWDLTNYLTYGQPEPLQRAAEWLQTALRSESSPEDVDSKWVAAHLLRLSDELQSSSVWAVLPPGYPGAAQAMTLGDPPVMLLWPPQLAFLEPNPEGISPFGPERATPSPVFPDQRRKEPSCAALRPRPCCSGSGKCVRSRSDSQFVPRALGGARTKAKDAWPPSVGGRAVGTLRKQTCCGSSCSNDARKTSCATEKRPCWSTPRIQHVRCGRSASSRRRGSRLAIGGGDLTPPPPDKGNTPPVAGSLRRVR
jgi:hypothetical protein